MIFSAPRTFSLSVFLTVLIACIFSGQVNASDVGAAEKNALAHQRVDEASAVASGTPGVHRDCTTPPDDAALLGEIEGFAKEAKITGGSGANDSFVVTSEKDYSPRDQETPVEGSLRKAVTDAMHLGAPARIVFAREMSGKIIELKEPIRVGSNITLNGVCSGVTLTAPAEIPLIIIRNNRNIIISGLTMLKHPYSGENKFREDGRDFRDCLTMAGDVDRIAIIHNNFGACGDGQIDITSGLHQPMPTAGGRITIAYNHFAKHDKAMLIGTDGCEDNSWILDESGNPDLHASLRHGCANIADPSFSGTLLKPSYNVTLLGNFFEWTGQRNPRAFGRVYVHLIDNIFAFEPYDRGNGTVGANVGTYVWLFAVSRG